MFERLLALESSGIKLGLDNILRLCEALGHPERSFVSLLVAGTNGKGSVTAMVHASLRAAGISAGRHTSPHLAALNERFVVGDGPVDTETLTRVSDDVLDVADGLVASGALAAPPTFFEATTAIAFELFRRAGVEAAAVEVGLGGRFDATNVLTPAVGAITSIGLDHQQFLGDTVEQIAFEKAGIIKPGMTLVAGRLPEAAHAVVAAVATERGARLVNAAHGAHVESTVQDGRSTVVIDTPEDRYGPVTLALRGDHQVGNALVAVRMLEAARGAGLWLSGTAIEAGLTAVEWPGRLELMTLAGGQRVLIDAAHNVDGARTLAAYLERWHSEKPALVLGLMRDKDVDGIASLLLPHVSSVTCTAVASARALPAPELAGRVTTLVRLYQEGSGREIEVVTVPDPFKAVELALGRDRTVCIAGSIFLAGEVRDTLKRRDILR